MSGIDPQRALRDLAASEMEKFWIENDIAPTDRDAAVERYARHLAAIGQIPDEVLEAMPEISRHNQPQMGPQEWDCGCVAVVRVTDRDVRHDEKPFEMRLALPCDGTKCSRREILMRSDAGRAINKACIKCDGPITTPLLGDDDERCVHCADFDPHDPDAAERDARDAERSELDVDIAIDDHDRCVDQAIARGLITKTFRDSAADRRALDAREQRDRPQDAHGSVDGRNPAAPQGVPVHPQARSVCGRIREAAPEGRHMNRDPRVREHDKRMASCPNVNTAGVCMYVGPCMTCAENRAALATSKIKVRVRHEISQSQIVTVPGDADDDEIVDMAITIGCWSKDNDGPYNIDLASDPKKVNP